MSMFTHLQSVSRRSFHSMVVARVGTSPRLTRAGGRRASSSPRASAELQAAVGAGAKASGGSVLKLGILSGCFYWLLQAGRLREGSVSELSAISFQAVLPCMLATKVATALSNSEPSLLMAMLPLSAVLQIAIGVVSGFLLRPMAYPADRSAVVAMSAFGNTFTLPLVFLSSVLPASDAASASAYVRHTWSGCSPRWSYAFDRRMGVARLAGGFVPGGVEPGTLERGALCN